MRAPFTSELEAIDAEIGAQLRDAVSTLDELEPVIVEPTANRIAGLLAASASLRQASRQTDLRLVRLTARQAPVACDLHLVLAMIQIVHHQALIANQFKLIAEQLTEIGDGVADRCGTGKQVVEMARLAREQLGGAATAFAVRDPHSADQLSLADDRLDRLNRKICQASLEMTSTVTERELALRHVLIARSLERVGDNAVGIARQTERLVSADVHQLAHHHDSVSLTPLA